MKKFLSLVLALVMTMSLVTVAGAKDFTDAADIDYTEAAEVLAEIGVLDGYTDGSFRPDNALNRGQAAKIICNLILGPTAAAALPTSVAPFSDVPAGSTFAGYIAYLAKEGIVGGYADGTFRPTQPLNGYAFMKMLLGVLGYDAKVEGYEGANYAVSVAKQALAIDLDEGLVDTFVGTKTVTRQEAVLFALNTLKAQPVKYDTKGTSIIIGGVTVQTGASEVADDTDYYDYAEKLFDGELTFDETQYDVYGRPGTEWTYDDEVIGTYGKEADVTYTAVPKLYTVKKDLKIGAGDDTVFYYTLNVAKTVVGDNTGYYDVAGILGFNSKSSTKLFGTASLADDYLSYYVGNGVKIEMFYDEDGADKSYIVVTDEYFGEIGAVKTDDDGRYVTIKGRTADKIYTEDFAKGDKVLYTIGLTADGIETVTLKSAGEAYVGTLTNIDGAKYTIGGTQYELHGGWNKTVVTNANLGDEITFYLDSCGYIINYTVTKASTAFENLALVYANGTNGFDTIAKVIYGDGKVETVTTKQAEATNEIYSVSMSAGKLKVKTNADYTTFYATDAYYFTKGATVIADAATSGNTAVKVDNATQFVYIESDLDTKVYTGYKAAPTFEATKIAAYVDNKATSSTYGIAKLVFVFTDDVSNSADDLVYMLAYDLTYSEYLNADNVVVGYFTAKDVKGNSYKVDSESDLNATFYKNAGVVVYDGASVSADGVYTMNRETLSTTDGVDYYGYAGTAKVVNEVLYLNGSAVAYEDDVVVYEIAWDGKTVETIDLDGLDLEVAGWTCVYEDGKAIALFLKDKA